MELDLSKGKYISGTKRQYIVFSDGSMYRLYRKIPGKNISYIRNRIYKTERIKTYINNKNVKCIISKKLGNLELKKFIYNHFGDYRRKIYTKDKTHSYHIVFKDPNNNSMDASNLTLYPDVTFYATNGKPKCKVCIVCNKRRKIIHFKMKSGKYMNNCEDCDWHKINTKDLSDSYIISNIKKNIIRNSKGGVKYKKDIPSELISQLHIKKKRITTIIQRLNKQ